ncbi:YolD-like family protein [Planococcus glaciei]|uniref:YolD-like family protein n=1 Tax=Planococcus glaciei TaxID=459472 RepID=A0A7H8QFT4_9BACL|nr:YolD-like family protein [Planococcus glaciei]ETP70035.1 hypothetical protein G159_04035 [Planococcus glaciei CHR43]MBX0313982.1 YolD-like family protein [Planococcus glaciei]QKX52335.1 YolD-like family protein [Planococcus glaciei]
MVLTSKIEKSDYANGQEHMQGLKLTRHINKLSQWFEENKSENKPEPGDWDSQMIQAEIEEAMERNCTIRMKSWKNHEFQYHVGTVKRMDLDTKSVYYDDPFGIKRLPLDEVVGVMIVN